MTCFYPIDAWQSSNGDVVFHEKARFDIVKRLQLPCGRCTGCRLERSRQWAMRIMHESQMHDDNCFVTLTFNDENLPKYGLDHSIFQRFMKRLRKSLEPKKIRFYMCGEYGEQFGRPHFHFCLFGHDFKDKKPFQKSPSGFQIYVSKQLDDLWGFGYTSIGDLTFESAAYVARYVMKKVTGDLAGSHYERVDLTTGEIYQLKPEYNCMSRGQGIGLAWYEKYKDDVYNNDYVIIRGQKCKPPRYYDNKFKKSYPVEFDLIQYEREKRARTKYEDNTEERLKVKEEVLNSRLNKLKRNLD